jgi:hypothetical protein
MLEEPVTGSQSRRQVTPCLRSDGTPKDAYSTKEKASRARDRVIERGGNAKTVKAYPCPRCHQWHVGNKILKQRRRQVRQSW